MKALCGQDKDFRMTARDDRLTTLEIRSAEQEQTIEELSGQIASQWKEIERLQKKLDALTSRFLELEEQTAPDVPVTKPPHW
jgi:SlyX protein